MYNLHVTYMQNINKLHEINNITLVKVTDNT